MLRQRATRRCAVAPLSLPKHFSPARAPSGSPSTGGSRLRFFLAQALILVIVALVIAAVVFRSGRAANALAKVRDFVLLYVLVIVAFGLFQYIRQVT